MLRYQVNNSTSRHLAGFFIFGVLLIRWGGGKLGKQLLNDWARRIFIQGTRFLKKKKAQS